MFQALKTVFTNWRFALVGIVAAFIFFLINLWLLNLGYLKYLIVYSLLPEWRIAQSFFNIQGLIETRLMLPGLIILIVIAVLAGVNIAMSVFLMRRNLQMTSGVSLTALGTVVALVGVGCLSCGATLLTALIGLTASVTLVSVLPLHGWEFSLLAVILMLISIWRLSSKINQNGSCKVSIDKSV